MEKKKRLFLGANWKMNDAPIGALDRDSPYRSSENVDVAVLPSFLDLKACIDASLTVGAQCGHAKDKGAFTGDVSMHQLKKIGCTYVLCGHSERRKNHHETDEEIAMQVFSAINVGLIPILCIGETAEENSRGETNDVLTRQLSILLQSHSSKLPPSSTDYGRAGIAQSFIVAYEPAWAIGTGTPANLQDIATIHHFIRSLLPATDIKILYGASLNATNAEEILSLPNVDGCLIGGASLKPEEFRKIVAIALSI